MFAHCIIVSKSCVVYSHNSIMYCGRYIKNLKIKILVKFYIGYF